MYLPESSVNYDKHNTHEALEWSLHNFFVLQLEPTSHRKQDLFVSESEIYFESKWSPVEIYSNGVPFVEFTAGSAWTEIPTVNVDGDVSFSDFYLRAASKKRVYSLDPYKILDLLGDMGGLLDIVLAFGVLVTLNVVKRAFDRSLLSDAYQVQGYTEDNTEYYESLNARRCFKSALMSSSSKTKRMMSQNAATAEIALTDDEDDSHSDQVASQSASVAAS